MEIRIPAVNDYVARLQDPQERADHLIDRRPCRYHYQYFTRAREACRQFRIGKSADEGRSARGRALSGEEPLRHLRNIVVNPDPEAPGGHIQGKAAAHDAEADEADVTQRIHRRTLAFPFQMLQTCSSSAGRA